MFTGVSFEQAMKYHLQGREVIVIDRNSKGANGKGYDTFPFEELFNNLELLADLPAVENPEWNKAVQQMVTGSSSTLEASKDEPQDKPAKLEVCEGNIKAEQKPKKEIVEQLVLQGLSNREIADQTGIKYPTVWAYAKEIRDRLPEGQQVVEDNSDRHLCKTCAFRGKNNNSISGTGCEFAVINGHSRGCSVEKCNVYKKGDPKKRKEPIVLA